MSVLSVVFLHFRLAGRVFCFVVVGDFTVDFFPVVLMFDNVGKGDGGGCSQIRPQRHISI